MGKHDNMYYNKEKCIAVSRTCVTLTMRYEGILSEGKASFRTVAYRRGRSMNTSNQRKGIISLLIKNRSIEFGEIRSG